MRIFRIVLVALGAIMFVLAALWRPVVAPELTKLPTSLDETVYFAGTYTGYVNQSTGAALSAPQQVPLSISRHVKAIAAKSTSSVLIVNDASAITIGPAKSAAVLQYAMNRSTELGVANPDSYALVQGNVVDRAGTYSLGPPEGADTARSYPLWTDEIGGGIPITGEPGTATLAGVSVQRWRFALSPTAMTPAMVAAMKLPTVMSFAAFAAELKAGGLDLTAALRSLSPSLTAAQRASLGALTATPIPLQYLYATHAQLLVEPVTGAIVDIVNAVRSYSVRPSLGHLATGLTPILAAHSSNPAAARLLAVMGKLASAPAQPLYTLTYYQTPASAAATARTAGHNAALLGIVRVWIPVILGVVGLVLAGLGLLLMLRRRAGKRGADTGVPAPAGTQEVIT